MRKLKPVLAVVGVLAVILVVECWVVPGAFIGSDVVGYADSSSSSPVANHSQRKHGYSPEDLTHLAQQGDAEAEWRLGVLYRDGDGVPQSDTEAISWFHRAADQGFIPAVNALANQHFVGRGVPQNYNEAYFWYDVALAKGDEAAASRLELLNTELTQDEAARAHQQAQEWLRQHPTTPSHP